MLEAGPCPVTGDPDRRARRLRGRPARVRRRARRSAHQARARAPEEGRRLRPPPPASSSATRPASCWSVETVTVEAFSVGDKIKVSGKTKGKGFQGTIKRHNFSERPEVPRLAQRPRAGLDRRLGDAVARVQGHPRSRPDGRRARHPARPDRGRDHPGPEPDAGPRRRSRARRGGTVEVRTDG